MNLTEVCHKAGISRETLYKLALVPQRLPTLETLVSLSDALQVHPVRLLQLIFDELPISHQASKKPIRGDNSVFVTETIPDGTLMLAGQKFTKTWEMMNVGNMPWENRYMQCMDEEIVTYSRSGAELFTLQNLIPATTRVPVPYTAPKEHVTVRVEFTAPKKPGVYFSYWKSVFEDGSVCFPNAQGLSVTVRVNSMIASSFEER